MTPEELPNLFADGWALPKPDPFLEHFLPLIDPDATFTQPMYPVAHGREQIVTLFRELFALLPDMIAIPTWTAVQGDTAFIESDCSASLGRKPVRFTVCDRFRIQNGRIIERRSHSDSLPLLLTTLRRPTAWPRAITSRR